MFKRPKMRRFVNFSGKMLFFVGKERIFLGESAEFVENVKKVLPFLKIYVKIIA